MPCLFVLLIALFPRVTLAVLYFFTRYLEVPYHNKLILLILGFLFLPLTTLVYAWMVNSGVPTDGLNVLFLVVAVILDLGLVGGGFRQHRSRR